jgi:hypothetical protein
VKRLWKRTTTALATADLPPGVLAAVRQHAERVGADDPRGGITRACLTTSESLERGGLFRRPPPPVDTYMLLADPLFVVAVSQEGKTVVSILRLDEIELKEYEPTLVDDAGLELLGMAVGATERAMRFLPLDHGRAGSEFRTALVDAARHARMR